MNSTPAVSFVYTSSTRAPNYRSSRYRPSDDAVLEQVPEEAERTVGSPLLLLVRAWHHCRYMPSVDFHWYKRGYDNALNHRRNELQHGADAG